jgi:hypothetical protein
MRRGGRTDSGDCQQLVRRNPSNHPAAIEAGLVNELAFVRQGVAPDLVAHEVVQSEIDGRDFHATKIRVLSDEEPVRIDLGGRAESTAQTRSCHQKTEENGQKQNDDNGKRTGKDGKERPARKSSKSKILCERCHPAGRRRSGSGQIR